MRVLLCDSLLEESCAKIRRASEERVTDGEAAIIVTGHAGTARSAFNSIASTKFDVILIDLFLPINSRREVPKPMSGPWLARAISAANPGLLAPLVMWADNVFTTLEYRNQCRAFRHNGGHHIIDKTWHPAAQLHTLDAALDGETWQPPSDGLTFAERQIVAYYVDGHDAQAIAIALNRSRATIESHITSVRQKLLPVPLPPGTARGAGPVLAAVASAGSCVSWVPVQYLREPSGVFAEIGKPEVSDGIDAASRDFTPIGDFESDRRRRHASSNATNRSDLHESDDVNDTAGVKRTGTATTTTHAGPLAFLCHASEDKPYVRRLEARLRSDGIRTWLDERDLMPGQEWERAIRAAVRQADVVVVCISRSSVTKRGYVQKEIREVLDAADEQPEQSTYVIPARIEPCDIPERLSRWQAVDLRRRGGYTRLLDALREAEGRRGLR